MKSSVSQLIMAYIRAAGFAGGCIGVIIFAFVYFSVYPAHNSVGSSLTIFPAYLFGGMILGPILFLPVGGLTVLLGRAWGVDAPFFYILGGIIAALVGIFAPLYIGGSLSGNELVAFFTEPARMIWPALIALAGAAFGWRFADNIN